MKVLVTGGAGYIGSTIVSALIDNGHIPVILDNLSTGREEFVQGQIFYKGDISSENTVTKIFQEHADIIATIHCAALIVVPESVAHPFEYYSENVAKSNILFHLLQKLGQKNIIFSSSAAVYAPTSNFRVTEESPTKPESPYAHTKLMMETILSNFCHAYQMKGIALRYFNPIGADAKLRSGIHVQFPSHVLGKLVDTASGKQPYFELTGTDWPTRDGSGIRDYFHVWDLAMAHVRAVENIEKIFKDRKDNFEIINLGTGNGVTVKELVVAFENVSQQKIKMELTEPRLGDNAGSYASMNKAQNLLNWKTELTLEEAIRSALEWDKIRGKRLKWS